MSEELDLVSLDMPIDVLFGVLIGWPCPSDRTDRRGNVHSLGNTAYNTANAMVGPMSRERCKAMPLPLPEQQRFVLIWQEKQTS
jgi:hypothetical protein